MKSSRVRPSTNAIGTKTQMVVSVEAAIALLAAELGLQGSVHLPDDSQQR